MGADFLHQAMAAGLTHYAAGDHFIDVVMDHPKPCRRCGHSLFSRWMHPEDHGVIVEIWSAIALGFEEIPEHAEIAESGWLCESCRITLDEL